MAASSTGKGQGNLDTVVLRHRSGASVEVYLFGATLCSYKTCDGKDQIFVSPGAKFDGKKAIRGGVPIVFPQFGQPDKAMAQHGFARISMWSLKEISDSADEARAVLTLSDSPETRALWNHAFRLEYVVSLRAKSLKLTLCVVNTGSAPFDFNCLLHTYFRVPDVAEVSVRGLMGLSYIDKVDGGATKTQADAHACLPSCTDSVYVGSTPGAKDAVVAPKDGPAMFAVTNEAVIAGDAKPCDIVLWNPYEAASPGDLPPPAFKNFVCVEPGLVSKMYELPSKATAELSQTIVPSQACSPAAMPVSAMRLLLCRPKVPAPLDPNFAPVVLAKKNYLKFLAGSPHFLEWALPRADGCGRYKLPVFADNHENVEASIYLAGVLIQEMMWQRSASSLLLSGSPKICEALKAEFSETGAYSFEVKSMPNVCGTPDKPFEVKIVPGDQLPKAQDSPQVCGKEATGCRLAFDLGKSDIKTVAVQDGNVLYSKETEWDVTNPDPDYHYKMIVDALLLAKAQLPRVDAVGGSATGTVSGANEATWCDIFPNVPPDVYKAKVVDIFKRIAKEVAGDVPLKVINDGEVTALAAVQKIGKGNIMGISMGSSEGGGYANVDGNLMGWINELCYVRLDLNPEAPTDPWTKGTHTGMSHMYLGQRGATKLASKAGVKNLPDNYVYPHPDMCVMKHEQHAQCLKLIQKAMADPAQQPHVKDLYTTIGVYLGYALAQYTEFYPINHVMILGRVSKGSGGDLMLETASKVLMAEFPHVANIQFHTADDHFKAVGQCIAAAALPTLG